MLAVGAEMDIPSPLYGLDYDEALELRRDFPKVRYSHYHAQTQTFHMRKLKSGKFAKRMEWATGPYYTVLRQCDLCGKVSTPRKITTRDDVGGWDLPKRFSWGNYHVDTDASGYAKSKDMLCISCWNKVKPIAWAEGQIAEFYRAIKEVEKTTRTIKKMEDSNELDRNRDRRT